MIENITGNNLNVIIKSRMVVNNKKYMKYYIDEKKIQKFYFLSIRNGEEHNYNYDLLKIFNIDEPIDYKKYCFGNK